MFPILRVKKRRRPPTWGRKNEVPVKERRKLKEEADDPIA